MIIGVPYVEAGASIIDTPEGFFNKADMIMKIKEPMPVEYDRLKSHQILFTYFHFASGFGLTKAMMKNNIICITYETVQTADGALPLLALMSEVAGEMSAHVAAYYLALPYGGTVGTCAAKMQPALEQESLYSISISTG